MKKISKPNRPNRPDRHDNISYHTNSYNKALMDFYNAREGKKRNEKVATKLFHRLMRKVKWSDIDSNDFFSKPTTDANCNKTHRIASYVSTNKRSKQLMVELQTCFADIGRKNDWCISAWYCLLIDCKVADTTPIILEDGGTLHG